MGSTAVPVIDVNVVNTYVVGDRCFESEGIVRGGGASRIVGYGRRIIIYDITSIQGAGIVPIEADQQPLKNLKGLSFPNQFHNPIHQNYSETTTGS